MQFSNIYCIIRDKLGTYKYQIINYARDRLYKIKHLETHNPKVVGSSPTPATTNKQVIQHLAYFYDRAKTAAEYKTTCLIEFIISILQHILLDAFNKICFFVDLTQQKRYNHIIT